MKKMMKTSKIMSPTGYCGHLQFSFDKPTKKFSAVNPYLLSLEVREYEAQIPNRIPFQNFFWYENYINENPAGNLSLKIRNVLLEIGENR